MEKKYQIFISSTYEDLKEERKKVQDTILSMQQFPIGMEMFSAADEDQWEIIRETIDSSDYYVLIIGYRYGSVIEEGEYAGISYTQKEFRYALEKKIPVLVFLIDGNVAVTPERMEKDVHKKEKLEEFIKEVKKGRIVQWWTSKDDLANKVMNSLNMQIGRKNRPGWIRTKNPEEGDVQRKITESNKAIEELNENKKELQREITELNLIGDEVRKKIEELNKTVDELNENKKELQGEITELNFKEDEIQREIIELNKTIERLNENKQELEEKTIELNKRRKQVIRFARKAKVTILLRIGGIAILSVLLLSWGLSLLNRYNENSQTNETLKFYDNTQKNDSIELSKGDIQEDGNTELHENNTKEDKITELDENNTQENESIELHEDNAQEDKNKEEIQSLEENDKIIDWEWEYVKNTDNMRRFLKNTPSELGITVSYYQGDIDWEKVKADGVDFAIIRVGSRGYEGGKLRLDSKFKENMDGAIANDIKAGVYFFSQAINQDEMEEEINEILKAIEGYSLGYPVGIELDCIESYRTYELSTPEHQKEYIDLIKYFCTRIKQNGYVPMMVGQLDWFHKFPDGTFDEYYKCIYSSDSAPNNIDNCVIWTYCEDSLGVIDGIDVNVSVGLGVYDGQND